MMHKNESYKTDENMTIASSITIPIARRNLICVPKFFSAKNKKF